MTTVWPATVSVPERPSGPGLAATVYWATPLPVTWTLETVNHAALLAAVQRQDAFEAVTVTEPVPPPTSAVAVSGATVNVQVIGVPGCETVMVCPPTVSVPERVSVEGFAAAVNCTVPFPRPLAPLVMVSHIALLAAVQLQPAGAETATDCEPPAAGTSSEELATLTVQVGAGAAPACVTVNV